MKKIVNPKYAEGYDMSLCSLFGYGPKWTITCGECEITFKQRLPLINYPIVICPYCHTRNKLNLVIN